MGRRVRQTILLIFNKQPALGTMQQRLAKVIKDPKGEREATEECKYVRVTEGEDSFIQLMFNANDMTARLKARVTLISRKRKH